MNVRPYGWLCGNCGAHGKETSRAKSDAALDRHIKDAHGDLRPFTFPHDPPARHSSGSEEPS